MAAAQHVLKRLIDQGRQYEDLPISVRKNITLAAWKATVKEHCISKGQSWSESAASTSCGEAEYYEDLLARYKERHRLFPYDLADYICTGQTFKPPITPFKYYSELLFNVLKEEKQYYQIPNFTAADIVRVLGIGRNEYIAILNACKAKRLLWRVNKGLAKEMLPSEPSDPQFQPWWIVNTIALQEADYRALLRDELALLTRADHGGLTVGQCEPDLLRSLYKRGLIYITVPVSPNERFVIPPLEGFVSNRDAEQSGGHSDPLEALLYSVLVANSERATVAEMANILEQPTAELQRAMSLLCRLGFATKLLEADDALLPNEGASDLFRSVTDLPISPTCARGEEDTAGTGARSVQGHAVAVVVDAEATSYLMMGALSPTLKKHSVTLFEGGRVMGDGIIDELIRELRASAEQGKHFEGEMQKLTAWTAAFSMVLSLIRDASGGRPIELLRRESLAGLAPAAARKVMAASYYAVVPITPLPPPPLPLSPSEPGPVHFGPIAEAATPWLALALHAAARSGPCGVAFPHGQRVWRLPPQLATGTAAALWPWNGEAKSQPTGMPTIVGAGMLLWHLNDALTRTAVLVQPLHVRSGTAVLDSARGCTAADLGCACVPLPLPEGDGALAAVDEATGRAVKGTLPSALRGALCALGLQHAIGLVRLLPSSACAHSAGGAGVGSKVPMGSGTSEEEGSYVPWHVQLGMPLYSLELCNLVSQRAGSAEFLEPEGLAAQQEGQRMLLAHLQQAIKDYSQVETAGPASAAAELATPPPMPSQNLLFDGQSIVRTDLSAYVQGMGLAGW